MKKLFLLSLILLVGCSSVTVNTQTDETGPYINVSQYEFYTVIEKPIDFSNISAYDDVDGLMSVSVKGYVNYNEAGEYYPILYSIDTSGNETDVPVTVYVKDAEYVEAENANDDIILDEEEKEEDLCTKEGTDNNYPCSVVVPTEASKYIELFEGENGQERCEKVKTEEQSCSIVYKNDHTFWGYGLEESN